MGQHDIYIREYDNIVIGPPIYFSELTGQLLNAVSKIKSHKEISKFLK
jgi:menaquinone-dependent protoporphyrinogen IX oxidase